MGGKPYVPIEYVRMGDMATQWEYQNRHTSGLFGERPSERGVCTRETLCIYGRDAHDVRI